jgi:hypothetical protein
MTRVDRDAIGARQRVLAALDVLQGDELLVLAEVAAGLTTGRKRFGYLDALADRRDWAGEALEEIRDGLVYLGAALVRQRKGAR